MIAVFEAVKVERLREDGRYSVAGDVRGERTHVQSHLGVRGAKVGQVAIPESVLRGALGARKAQPVVVQEHSPRVYAHPPLTGGLAQLAEGVPRAGELADTRLQTLVAGDLRREEDSATLHIAHLTDRVVRKDVPGVVVGDGHRKPVHPRLVSDVIQDRTYTLIAKVGGKGEYR